MHQDWVLVIWADLLAVNRVLRECGAERLTIRDLCEDGKRIKEEMPKIESKLADVYEVSPKK